MTKYNYPPGKPVTVCTRIDGAVINRIERARPPYGWRSELMRHVFAYVAEQVDPGSEPSMHTILEHAEVAADQLFTEGSDAGT